MVSSGAGGTFLQLFVMPWEKNQGRPLHPFVPTMDMIDESFSMPAFFRADAFIGTNCRIDPVSIP
jgi:hypothetical protein